MNSTQKKIALSAIACVIAVLFFPPWEVYTDYASVGLKWRFVFSDPRWFTSKAFTDIYEKPQVSVEWFRGRLRFDILTIEVILVGLIAAGCFVYFKDSRRVKLTSPHQARNGGPNG
jgi:hypothetical protein